MVLFIIFGYFGKSVFTRRASSPYTIQNINIRRIVKEIESCGMGVSHRKLHMTVIVLD